MCFRRSFSLCVQLIQTPFEIAYDNACFRQLTLQLRRNQDLWRAAPLVAKRTREKIKPIVSPTTARPATDRTRKTPAAGPSTSWKPSANILATRNAMHPPRKPVINVAAVAVPSLARLCIRPSELATLINPLAEVLSVMARAVVGAAGLIVPTHSKIANVCATRRASYFGNTRPLLGKFLRTPLQSVIQLHVVRVR